MRGDHWCALGTCSKSTQRGGELQPPPEGLLVSQGQAGCHQGIVTSEDNHCFIRNLQIKA